MKFSTRAEYGLKAMSSLAAAYPAQKTLREVSLEENISLKYLERIISVLRKNRLVKSRRGKDGGYVLSRQPAKTKVGEIVEALEGLIAPMGCEDKKCSSLHCRPKKVWLKLGRLIRKNLYSLTLKDLI